MNSRLIRGLSQHALLLALAVLLCTGCSGARMTSTYREPSFTGPIQFKKMVVLAIHPERIARMRAEDAMVRQLGLDRAVAGHTIVTDEERKQLPALKAKLQSQGIDGAITMKLAGTRTEEAFVANAGSSQPF